MLGNLGYDKGATTLRQVIESNNTHKFWIDTCIFSNCKDVEEQNILLRFKFERLSLAISDFVEARANELVKRCPSFEGTYLPTEEYTRQYELNKKFRNETRDARKTT